MIKFSVVIPLYNKSYAVKRCLESVFNQEGYLQKVIIVNDGSTDDSLSVVNNYFSDRIESGLLLVVDKKNEGVSVARNTGTALCKSEYICFLDADDEWNTGYLGKMAKLINDFPKAVLYSLAFFKAINGNKPKKSKQGLPEGFRGYVEDFFLSSSKGNVVLTSTACVKKTALDKVGGFPDGVAASQDLYLWILLALEGPVACDVSFMAIQHLEVDNSRKQRNNSVPYPLVYFSKESSIELTPSLNRYLFTIFYKHFAASLINVKPKEALLRLYFYTKVFHNYRVNR